MTQRKKNTARRSSGKKCTVLVTGFEPFDGATSNPSEDVARLLHHAEVSGCRVNGGLLPCVFGAATRELFRLIAAHDPVLVICVGLAGERIAVTPERAALNVVDARIPDNAGRQPVDEPVVRGGPAAYWSTLPVKAIVAEISGRGIPAKVSESAGTFVCNHVFYGLMHRLRRRKRIRAGFIHIPPATNGSGTAVLSVERSAAAILTAIEVSLR